MLRNYLVTAIRSLIRSKMAAVISIAGLALGMSCALLIFLFIQFEFSFDRFHEKRDRIFSVLGVGTRMTVDRVETVFSSVVYEAAPRLKTEFPEIKNVVRMSPLTGTLRYKDRLYEEDNIYFTETDFFDMFNFPLLRGNPETALAAPNSVVLTPAVAEKYFGTEDPMGKVITFKQPVMDEFSFTVTGILAPIPKNSSIQVSCLAHKSFDSLKKFLPQWMPLYSYIYVELFNPSETETLKRKLKELTLRDFYADHLFSEWHFTLRAFSENYFGEPAPYRGNGGRAIDPVKRGNLLLVFLLIVLSVLILAISCINVMNLSTARSAIRAKEIGIRKVVGSDRKQLIFQFLVEAVLLSILSLLLSLVLVELFLPHFNTMVNRELGVDFSRNWMYFAAMVGIAVLTGLCSGLYPAFFLSAFRPVETLKGENAPASVTLRKTLMIAQLVVSICIFIFSLLITREAHFLREKPVGFATRDIITFKLDDDELGARYPGLKKALLDISGVSHVTCAGHGGWDVGVIAWSTFTCLGTDAIFQQRLMLVDPDYLRVFNVPMLEGDNFPENRDNADNLCIISRSAKKELGFDDILGKKLRHGGFFTRQVAGVCEDFHYQYPTAEVRPLVMVPTDNYWGLRRRFISVRLQPGDHGAAIGAIETTVKKFFPNLVFKYWYVDREIEKMHKARNDHWEIALKFSTGFSIFIACLGLFGFAEYETARKTKEIGIRKALGATRAQIAGYFVSGFVKIAVIANIIAWPLSFAFVKAVLRRIDYPYPFNMGLPLFLFAGVLMLLVTVSTISIQTFRAASVNPVDALRDE